MLSKESTYQPVEKDLTASLESKMNAQLTDESEAVWLTLQWDVLVTEEPCDQSAPLVMGTSHSSSVFKLPSNTAVSWHIIAHSYPEWKSL